MDILNIKPWNKKVITLTESQIGNLISKHSKKGFFIISACRSNLSDEENQKRTNTLKNDLKSLRLTYTVVYGGGFEEKQNENKGTTLENPQINETSFLVYNYRRNRNDATKNGSLDRDDLLKIALELCKKYNQDDIFFMEPNGKSHWIDREGNIDATFEKKLKVNDHTQKFFTAFGKNIEGSKNTPDKNGKMSKANADRFSGVMEGIYFNPPPATFLDKYRRTIVENEVFIEDITSYFNY